MKANTKIVQVFAELGTRDNFSDNKTDCLRQNIIQLFVQWYSGLGTRDNLRSNGTDLLRQNIVQLFVQWYAELGTRVNLHDNKTDCFKTKHCTVVCASVCRAGHSRQP